MMSKVIKNTHELGRESMDNAVKEMTSHCGFAPAHWVLSRLPRNLSPWAMRMIASMWVQCKHMPMDQQPSGYNHITEQKHAKLSYDGTAVNESERPHLWLDPAKSEILSRIAEKHAQANTDYNGALVPD